MVEQQHLDVAAVVGIDDAGARVDEVLGGEARPGRNTAIWTELARSLLRRESYTHTCTCRHGDANVRVDEDLAPGGNSRLARRVEVVAGGKGAASRRQAGLFRDFLDLQSRQGVVGLDALGGRRGDGGFGGRGSHFGKLLETRSGCSCAM